MEVLYAALVLGGMGAVFGILLTVASKIFAVPANPKRDAVRELLPWGQLRWLWLSWM